VIQWIGFPTPKERNLYSKQQRKKAINSFRSGIEEGSRSDVVPPELVSFFVRTGYKDFAPTELFFQTY